MLNVNHQESGLQFGHNVVSTQTLLYFVYQEC